PPPAAREAMALAIATRLAGAFRDGGGGLHDEQIAADLDVPVRTVRSILGALEARGLVAARGDPKLGAWQLGRAAEGIGVLDVIGAIRGSRAFGGRERPQDPKVQRLMGELERAWEQAAAGRTLADLVDVAAGSARARG